MANKCIFCKKQIYDHNMCEQHYLLYLKEKGRVWNLRIKYIEVNQYYHNLKHSVYKFTEYEPITELCCRLIAIAEYYYKIMNSTKLLDIVYRDIDIILKAKVPIIKEFRKLMNGRYTGIFDDMDFRKKWRANYRASDGHYVRSVSELAIDNWLTANGIIHEYEKSIALERETQGTLISDFYIPEIDTHIEFYGKYDKEYMARRRVKEQIYKENNIDCIALTSDSLKHLDDVLSQEIKNRKVQIQKKGQQ